jgi:tetratricopeptide (TPR) repeat protein
MKRFSFFNELSNWFVPFYPNHPDVMEVLEKTGMNRFLNVMMEKGPFCNSDKYSFVFAFQQVISQIPQNMRGMLERGEATLNELPSEELESAAYIRRIYLQDLYRFFRLFPERSAFVNPFDMDGSFLFFADPIFSKTHLELFFNDVTAFFLKQDRLYNVLKLLANYGEARRDFQFWMMSGYLAQHYANESALAFSDLQSYTNALEIQPDHERALAGLARALFSREMYEEALETYDKLLTICPEKKSYRLNFAVSLTNLGRYDEALKELYRLNYEMPDDRNVNRVLAWTLVCEGKYEAADKIYDQLLAASNVYPDDLLNYGYSLWFSGHIDEAADCFHRFLKETDCEPEFILENEADLLREKGITEPEQQMMLYIL